MKSAKEIDPAELNQCSMEELHELWRQTMRGKRRDAPPTLRRNLVRELAWEMHEQRYGQFDPETKRLLRAAMRAAEREIQALREGHPSGGRPQRPRPPAAPRRRTKLSPGTKLIRTWHGKEHEVVVEGEARFQYQGDTYGSLSEIARLITGTRWSGPRFFGLAGRGRGAKT
ncbi:MAG: DUF2924 domain-containing protein [Phycisphaerales bacterium]|nr:DUF2924 domain-containing protein [Phycisphaerales bacterium]